MMRNYIRDHEIRFICACIGIVIAALTNGCAAVPAAAGYLTSGGVTLYKSAKETGPKAEFVLIKVEMNHNCK